MKTHQIIAYLLLLSTIAFIALLIVYLVNSSKVPSNVNHPRYREYKKKAINSLIALGVSFVPLIILYIVYNNGYNKQNWPLVFSKQNFSLKL